MPFFSETRRGELAVVLAAALWSVFPVVTILTLNSLLPLYAAAFGTLAAAGFFAVVLTIRKRWHELGRKEAWPSLLLTTFFIGILFYAFLYTGLRTTSAGNASILALMEVFFSFLILGLLLRHEHITWQRIAGASCMVAGALIILLPKASELCSGDFLIILATLFCPLGNMYAQRARSLLGADTIMFFRSVVSGLFLLLLARLLDPFPPASQLLNSMWYVIGNGIFLLGLSKILWLESIHRIPITHAISLESLSPALTLLVAFFVLHEPILASQILGFLPMVAGVLLLTTKKLPDALST